MKFLTLTFLIILGTGSVACAGESNASDPFYGVWESSYGHLFFTYRTSKSEIPSSPQGKGIRAAYWSYPDSHGTADNGRIIATVNGNELQGYWIGDSGENTCETERDGSVHWGKVRFTSSDDHNEMTGFWSLCDNEPEGDDADWIMWRDELRDWDPDKE
jgi:hypothetical protein